MRSVIIPFLLCVLLPAALAQSPTSVDQLTAALDSLAGMRFDNWKMSPDLKQYRPANGSPTDPRFDDSGWQTLRIGESVYPDSCWLRKEITIPKTILGKATSGPFRLLVSVDDYGYLWVNGEFKGHFPWSGDFELTHDAQPGQRFLLAIKAVNTGGPLRLLKAELRSAATQTTRQMIEDFVLSLRTGQKLLGFDTYQTSAWRRADPKVDKSTMDRKEKEELAALLQSLARKVDVDALREGSLDRFQRSLNDVRRDLKPIAEYAKRFSLFFDSNAHIDAAWLWREKETIEVCKNTFGSVLNMMTQRPDFTYTQSAAAYYDWMERLYPEIFQGIAKRVKEGRWEIVGGMWVEPDCNIPSGESWARHLLYAKRYFKQKFGVDVKIGWNPDSFGYNANMPMFYRNAGIDAFITQKIGWNDTNVFPYRLFWWESPDGSTILAYFPFDYVSSVDNPIQMVDWVRQYEANTGFRKVMVLFGVGDHGGGPSLEMLARIDRLEHLDIFPRIEHGTASQYLTWLRQQDLSTLPIWKDELYLEYHQGTYTTQAAMKKFNRTEEALLTNAEKFSSFASLYGRPYNGGDLQDAWRKVLFTQFHDILPGSSIREVYIDATRTHKEAEEIGNFELSDALQTLAGQVNTSKQTNGRSIVVFNSLSWSRTDLVRITLQKGDRNCYAVLDARGKVLPSQILTKGKYDRELIFVAQDVPALGYQTFELHEQQLASQPSTLRTSEWQLANALYTITVDPKSGWLSSIKDSKNNRELLSGPGNELQLLEDLPTDFDAWNIGWTGVRFPTSFRGGKIVEQGPVRTILRLERDYLKPGRKKDFPTEDFPTSFFTQDIILYDGLDRIDFVTDVDWWEDKTMLKVAFPLTVQDTVATYEIPYGTIQRSTQLRNSWEKAKVEVPASRWADVSAGGYGVSLLNIAKYGYDIKGNTIRLSLLRSPKSPDPTADRGRHRIEYSLYPHEGSWQTARTMQRGYEANVPLIPVITNQHSGPLPLSQSFVRVSPDRLVLTSIKKAEDSDAWIIQWYNPGDREVTATVELPKPPKRVVLSDFNEVDGSDIPFSGKTVEVGTGRNSVRTLKCTF